MKGWPKPKEVTRQAWLATYAVNLAEKIGTTAKNIITQVKIRLHLEEAKTAEEALLQLYAENELPAPGTGQLHLIIKDGSLFAPGEDYDA